MSSMPAIGLSPRQQKQRRRMSDAKHRASVAASYKQLQKVLPSTYDYHGVKEISRQTKIVRAAVSHINKLEETLDKILKLRAYKFGDRAGYSKTLYMIRRQFREQFLYNEAIQAQREKKTKKRVYQRKKKLVSVAELPTCPSVVESPSPQIGPSKVHPMTSTSTGKVHLVDVGVKVPSQLSSSMPNQVKYKNEVRPHSSGKEGPKTPYQFGEYLPTEPTFASTSQETTMSDMAQTTSTIGGTCSTEYNHPKVDGMKPSGTLEVEDATGPETDPRNRLFVTSTPKMLVRPATFSSPDPVRSYREFEGYLLFYEHMVNQLQEQLQLPTQHLHSIQMSTTIQEIWKELPVACRRAITSTATSEVPKAAKLSRMKAVVSISMDRASLQSMKSKEHAYGERLSTSSGKACSKKTACIKLASPLPCEADFHKFLEQQGIELAQLVKDTSPAHVEGDYLDWSDEEEEDENEYVVFLDDKMGFGNPKDPQTCLMHCDAEVPTFHKPDIQEKKEYSTQVVPSADTGIKQEPSDIDDGTLATNLNGLVRSEDTSARRPDGRNVKREPMWNGSSDGEEGLPNCPVTPVFGAVSPATEFRSPVLEDKSLAKLPVDGTHIWTVDVEERSLDLDKIFTKGGRSKTAMLPQQQDFLCSPTYQSLLSSGFLPRPPTTPDSSHQVVPDLGSPADMLTDTDGYGEFWSPEESLFSLEKTMEPLSEMDQSNTSHSLECEEDSRDLDDDDL